MNKGESNDRGLWAGADADSRRTKREACGAYDCKELVAFLAANPERESALLRAFMDRQMGLPPAAGA